jgi:hypothetical protein
MLFSSDDANRDFPSKTEPIGSTVGLKVKNLTHLA